MTLHDVRRLTNHWKRMPPLRFMVAAIAASLGVDVLPNVIDTSKHMTYEEAQAHYRATGGRIDGVARG